MRVETERLVTEATARIEDGATNDELVAWLESEPLVEEVEGDAYSVRFRPTGGRGVWLTRPAEGAADGGATGGPALALSGTMEGINPAADTNASVTGPGRSSRRALVLSPYRWDFGESDDGEAVAQRLRELPDYANGVSYAENATFNSTDVTVEDFQGWDDMQVVHLVSHGARLCKAGKCRAFVAANVLPGGTANIFPSTIRGLELEVEVGSPTPQFHVVLGADAFRDEYPGGLGDTVVFLNGCSTFGPGATDLADAIRGSGSVVLGWSRPVDSGAAQAASHGIYEELAGNGRPVGEALEHIGDLATDDGLFGSTLTSTGRAAGGDLRIREVVDFEAAENGQPLAAGASVQLVGRSADGVPDSVLWRLQVDGIEPAAAPAAGVQVTIDGHAATSVTVATGAAEANDSWELSGTLDLGVDISAPHPALFEVTLGLPDGGTSVDSVSAVLVAQSEPTPGAPSMGSVWRGEATYTLEVSAGVKHTAHADLIFMLNRVTDGTIFSYELSGGTMTYAVSGTETAPDGCKHELAPVEFAIDPDDSDANFVIDTRDSPPSFYGHANISGPIVEVMQTCYGEYAYLSGPWSTRADGMFMSVAPDQGRTVENDRISGIGADQFSSWTFEFSRSE